MGDQRRLSRRAALASIGAATTFGLGVYLSPSEQSNTVKAAWVYIGTVGDLGWSWAHDQGRRAVDRQLDWLETSYAENVTPENATETMESYIYDDYDVLFGTSFEHMEAIEALAESYSNVVFEHCSGSETRENLGGYFGRMYQARYLSGVAAGLMTDTDVLGYVAAFPLAEIVRGINAFTLGARSVNDAVVTKVRWTNSWNDTEAEREHTLDLLNHDADVIAQHQDSPTPIRTASQNGAWAIGYDAPMQDYAGRNYLTSPIWHWQMFYEPTLKAIYDDRWAADFYWGGLEDGVVSLDEWGPRVPSSVQTTVAAKQSAIVEDELNVWNGSQFAEKTEDYLFKNMQSYVEGVDGTVPTD